MHLILSRFAPVGAGESVFTSVAWPNSHFLRVEVGERKSDQLARPAGDLVQMQYYLLLRGSLELEARFTAAVI